MKKMLFLMALNASLVLTNAQSKQYTIQDATLGLKTNLAPEKVEQPAWIPNTNIFTFLDKKSENASIESINAVTQNKKTVFTLKDLNSFHLFKEEIRSMPTFHWISEKNAWFQIKNSIFIFEQINGQSLVKKWGVLPEAASNIEVSADGSLLVFTLRNNLWFMNKEGVQTAITNDENEHIVNGQSVHRNEFGINKGIFISPSSHYIAYYKMDETMVNDYPIVDWDTVPAVVKNIKYPMAGGTSHQVQLVVYNIADGKKTIMNVEGPKDQYLTAITWNPTEASVYIGVLNRAQKHLWLNEYQTQSGKFLQTLFEETDSKYVEPQNPLYFIPNHNDQFLWMSQRNGYMHLYRYNINGKLLNQVTHGEWIVNELIGFNSQRQTVIFTSTKESPLEKHVYEAPLNALNQVKLLDHAAGIHTPLVSSDGSLLFDQYQNDATPRIAYLVNLKNDKQVKLLEAKDPLKDYQRPLIEDVKLTAADGITPLYGKIIYPIDFDKNKKYPVIVYLYNGPHVQLITNTYPKSGNLWYEYMAQHGYIVFTMDGRGSGNRGLAFEQATFKNLGTEEMKDQMKGVDYLKSLPFVDTARMGIHGWSFGGFMTTSIMTRYPNIFKCAVAGGPVINWAMYEVMYTERYMEQPNTNMDGYKNANLLNRAKDLRGHLLMIHGSSDPTVVWQQSMKFIKKCVEEKVQIDYFVYPGHEHNVLGKDRVHLMQKITDYFDLYLK